MKMKIKIKFQAGTVLGLNHMLSDLLAKLMRFVLS